MKAHEILEEAADILDGFSYVIATEASAEIDVDISDELAAMMRATAPQYANVESRLGVAAPYVLSIAEKITGKKAGVPTLKRTRSRFVWRCL